MYISRLCKISLCFYLIPLLYPSENDNPITRLENAARRVIWWKNAYQWTYNHWKPLLATGCATSIAAGFAWYKLHQKGIYTPNFLATGLCGYTLYRYISDQETKELIVNGTNRILEHQDTAERRTDKRFRIIYGQSETHKRELQKNILESEKHLRLALFASEIKVRAKISKESARLHCTIEKQKQDILAQIIAKDRNTTENFIKLHQEVVGVGKFAAAQSQLVQSNIVALGNALPKIQSSLIASTDHTGKNMQQMLQAMAQAQGLDVELKSEPFVADDPIVIACASQPHYEPIIQEKFAELDALYEKTAAAEEARMEEKIKRKREKFAEQQQLFAQELAREYEEKIKAIGLEENPQDPFEAIPEIKLLEAPTPLHDQIRKLTPFALKAIAPGTALVLEKVLTRYWHAIDK